MKTIPIDNLYYLLSYAWDQIEERQPIIQVARDKARTQIDLFGQLLKNGSVSLISQGLDRTYVTCEEEFAGIRGKLDFSASTKRVSLQRGRAVCRFGQLTYNNLHNQILKTTIKNILACESLDREHRRPLHAVSYRMREIETIEIKTSDFRRVKIHRNNRVYKVLLQVCEFVHKNLQVDSKSGKALFPEFPYDHEKKRDRQRMAKVYEKFIRNFYKKEQRKYRVKGKNIKWQELKGQKEDTPYIPEMRTDVSLTSDDQQIVIDAKFYLKAFKLNPHGQLKIRSSHLYQLYAYLNNLRCLSSTPSRLEGILLYPTVGTNFDLQFEIQSFPIRVLSINLNQEWSKIHDDLLSIIGVEEGKLEPSVI